MSFDGREWSDEFIGKYSYAIYKNEYTLRSMIFSGALNDGNVHIATDDFEMGEYEMEITPLLPQGSTIPLATIGRTKFFISENDMVAPLAAELISEKRAYAPGEMMRVSLLAPITTGVALVHIQTPHALITRHHTLSGSLTPLDIEIPQTSSQAVRLFALVIDTEKKQYFRAELPINIMQKRGVRIQADVTSQVYSRNEPIPIEISVSDQENAPIPSEVLVRIIPEGGVKDNIMPSQDLWQRSI